jgi:hypothetical protein
MTYTFGPKPSYLRINAESNDKDEAGSVDVTCALVMRIMVPAGGGAGFDAGQDAAGI